MCRHHSEPGSVQLVVSCLFTAVGSVFLLVLMAGSVGSGRTGSGLCSSAVLLVLLAGVTGPVRATSEPGKWTENIQSEGENKPQFFTYRKSLFNGSTVHLRVLSQNCTSARLVVSWYLRNSHCYNEVYDRNLNVENYFNSEEVIAHEGTGSYVGHTYTPIDCEKKKPHIFHLDPLDPPKPLKNPNQNQQQQKGGAGADFS
ncbi:transmembrane protein 87A-like [Fundulus diaphanus]